jgi:hypothetical protein
LDFGRLRWFRISIRDIRMRKKNARQGGMNTMGETYPRFKAASVQASPVFLDRQATVHRACHLMMEASKGGAKLVAFPETFVPGYPYETLFPGIL